MKKLMILSGVALLGLAGSAVAQGPVPTPRRGADISRAAAVERAEAVFARLDANHDGRFTREEAQALREQRREQRMTRLFGRIDANHDGQISQEEFAQGHQGRRGPGMHRPDGPGPIADGGPDGPPRPGGPGMRRHGRGGPGGPGMRMGMGAGMAFGDAGFITAEQFRNIALARFDRADANHDGTLTVAERHAQRGQMRGRSQRRMGPPPGGPDAPPPPDRAG